MLPQRPERGALIDLWGTILYPFVSPDDYARERSRRILEALLEIGVELDEQRVHEAYKATRGLADKIRDTTQRELPLEGEVILLLDKLGVEPREEAVRRLSEAYIYPYLSLVAPANGVGDFLKKLKNSGFKLILASNTMSTTYSIKLLKLHGLHELFDYMAFSDSVGYRKPHPRFFSHIVSATGIAPAESFLIGDEEADIKGAKLFGFKTIAYTGFHPYTGHLQPDCKADTFEAAAECLKTLGLV
jgi:putative hydrolase of the HAD superfamily